MKKVEILKLNAEMLKLMSKLGLKDGDFRYIPLYEEYLKMRKDRFKVDVALAILAEKYKVSESTIKRVFRRLSGEVIC